MARNLCLTLFYVSSKDNLADAPSRVLCDIDCSLSDAWRVVDGTFGPHSVDLMALRSSVWRDPSGRPLFFYCPFSRPQSVVCNVFSHEILSEENAYVFPPFVLIGPLLRFLVSQSCALTIFVPDISPRKYWWPLFNDWLLVASEWDLRETVLFYCSRPNPALLPGKLVLSSGISGYFELPRPNSFKFSRIHIRLFCVFLPVSLSLLFNYWFFSFVTSAIKLYLSIYVIFLCFMRRVGCSLGRWWIFPTIPGFCFATLSEKHLGGKTNTFLVKESRNVIVYPVSNLRRSVGVSDLVGVDLRGGYLFRTTDKEGAVTNNPFLGSAVANRLLTLLKT